MLTTLRWSRVMRGRARPSRRSTIAYPSSIRPSSAATPAVLPPSLRCHPQTVFYTSLRKFTTLTLSYLLFPKPITLRHAAGAALLCLGIYLNDKVRCGAAWRAHFAVWVLALQDALPCRTHPHLAYGPQPPAGQTTTHDKGPQRCPSHR